MTIFWIIFWIVLAIAAPTLLFFIGRKNAIVKIALQVLLFVSIIFLAKGLYDGIMQPIRFEQEMTVRYKVAVHELMQIRKAQEAYKRTRGKYTPSFDSLVAFVKSDSLRLVIKTGSVHDSIFERPDIAFDRVKAEKYALEKGYITRDTTKVSVVDSLFKNYNIERLGAVPGHKDVKFKMDTAIVNVSGIKVPVFEAVISNNILLEGLEKQLIINLNDNQLRAEQYPGLKVGSLKVSNNNEGNWSKEYELK